MQSEQPSLCMHEGTSQLTCRRRSAVGPRHMPRPAAGRISVLGMGVRRVEGSYLQTRQAAQAEPRGAPHARPVVQDVTGCQRQRQRRL